MRIHVYAPCYNEETLLPFFLRHYGSFAERIVIFDDGSNDRSCEIMSGYPNVECIRGTTVYSDASRKVSETLLLRMKNEAYKSSRGSADWVIVVDLDEFIYHPDLVVLLAQYKASGITLPAVQGYDMVSERPPSGNGQIYQEIRQGFANPGYCKNAVFHPDLDINYGPGCHACDPKGDVRTSESAQLKLLHYRFLGVDYFSRRYRVRRESLSAENLKNGWGAVITVPGASGTKSIHQLTDDALHQHYFDILRDQHIVDLVQCSPPDRWP